MKELEELKKILEVAKSYSRPLKSVSLSWEKIEGIKDYRKFLEIKPNIKIEYK